MKKPTRKRKFNAFAVRFKRGRATGPTHMRILKELVLALRGIGPMWYDHMYLPSVPLTLSPTPVKIPHMSPNPDIVIMCGPKNEEMFMIQVQRVYPIKRAPKTIPHNMTEKEEVTK